MPAADQRLDRVRAILYHREPVGDRNAHNVLDVARAPSEVDGNDSVTAVRETARQLLGRQAHRARSTSARIGLPPAWMTALAVEANGHRRDDDLLATTDPGRDQRHMKRRGA